MEQESEPQGVEYLIKGTVASFRGAEVAGLRVEIVDKNVGADVRLGEVSTVESGNYQCTFKLDPIRQRGKQQLDLQARVYLRKTFLGSSDTCYNATTRETLNIILPQEADSLLPSEHEALTNVLSKNFKGNLRDLKETNDRQDITFLANKTGWDARAVAFAALADKFSSKTVDENGNRRIEPAFFYSLFRAGLPANEDVLYNTDIGTVEAVWKSAANQGLIPQACTAQIPKLIEQFKSISANKLLASPALVGISSIKKMLTASGLNKTQRRQFAELYATYRKDMPTFWKMSAKHFGKRKTNRLQLDGKLGFLTINNTPLVRVLKNQVGNELLESAAKTSITDPLQLVQTGYYRAEKWRTLLNNKIHVPKEIPGDTIEAKRTNYAEYLAAQLRLSYPTATVAAMVSSGDLKVESPNQVYEFLSDNQGKFEIGMQPVQQYISRNDLKVAEETIKQVTRLQRLWQITTSHEAMAGLSNQGIGAAYDVIHFQKTAFVKKYAGDVGGPEIAAQIYERSVQVQNAVMNIALSYLTSKNGIALGRHLPNVDESSTKKMMRIINLGSKGTTDKNVSNVLAISTLENLFHSMDFCTCDECRSILSPAAYLVDLLHFIDFRYRITLRPFYSRNDLIYSFFH